MAASILIVEDNEDNMNLMRYLLKTRGYESVSARTGAEGVKAAARELPDLILMDLQMPEMDGFQAMHSIRSLRALDRTPIVAVTALAMVGDSDRVVAAGFDGYVAKPIEPETFLDRVEDFLRAGVRGTEAPREAGE